VKIKTVNESLVRETMQSLAKFLAGQGFLGVQVTDKVGSYYVDQIRHVISGITAEDIRGFGVSVEGGKLVIVGDDYAQKLSLEAFTKLFENFYVATTMQRALQSMGYRTSAQILPNKTIAVRGVSGAGYIG